MPLHNKTKKQFSTIKKGVFAFWTKMAIKVKPQGLRFKKFEIWTKMAKVPKPQGPKWQFTLILILVNLIIIIETETEYIKEFGNGISYRTRWFAAVCSGEEGGDRWFRR
ncbi:hypothetical protein Hanom_Chr01g00005571 [Helianthus anomalus]